VLRRLDDEPLAVPDRVSEHVAACAACSGRRARISEDAARAARLVYVPQLVPDSDLAWARFQRELRQARDRPANRRARTRVRRRPAWLPSVSLRSGLAIGAVGVVVAGTAAAATLTTIFAPTHVAAVPVSRGDLRAITGLMGLGDGHALGGFAGPSGSTTVTYGTIRWSSAGRARPVSSRAEASAAAGFPVPLPAHLPTGVGPIQQFIVQPRVRATATFSSAAGSLAGSSVTLSAGPAVLAAYGGTSGNDVPTLAVATMPRPTATSTGASLGQVEAFLLSQPGIPPQLAEEIRLLGDLRTTLPVPVPAGASVRSVQIGGWPGVMLADSSNVAAGIVWEDGRGMLHAVAGLLDSQDVLNVARQLG
jgi:hypothetical protein